MLQPDPCGKFRALASCELDGEILELDAVRLRRHLASCGDCSDWIADVREWKGLLQADDAPEFRNPMPVAYRHGLRWATAVAATGASVTAAALVALTLSGAGARLPATVEPDIAPLTSTVSDTARAAVVRGNFADVVRPRRTDRPQGRFGDT